MKTRKLDKSNVVKGLHRGTFTADSGALLIQGVIHGDLRVSGDADVELRGMVRGNVLVMSGTLRLPGIVTGNVTNRGGMLHVSGRVQGEITTEGGATTTTESPSTDVAHEVAEQPNGSKED